MKEPEAKKEEPKLVERKPAPKVGDKIVEIHFQDDIQAGVGMFKSLRAGEKERHNPKMEIHPLGALCEISLASGARKSFVTPWTSVKWFGVE